MTFNDRLHAIWSRLFNRNLQGANAIRRIRGLYALPDPWQLGSPKEQARFAWTNDLVKALPARPARVLEIGCGEGHQSLWLSRTCDTLAGVDLSDLAVARAARRLPEGRFSTTPWLEPDGRARLLAEGPYDLVTACEMLYYLSDVPAALDALESLGRTVLVSCYEGKADYVMPHVRARAGANLHTAAYTYPDDGTVWRAAWWTPATSTQTPGTAA